MEWYIKVLKNYAISNGRASRKEYWMFTLFNLIISFSLGIFVVGLSVITKTDQTVLYNIYNLAVFVPSITVGIRKMHDTDRNGWWCVVPIINLVYLIEAGHPETNKYDPAPNQRKS